ncbi:MAG: hypothetical protein NTU51_06875 [Bacteroidetes bacterium]|nr:hypothetical protein [Bacteroidota bacterium]
MKKIFKAVIPVLFLSLTIQAQEKSAEGYSPTSLYTLSWTLSLPLGSFSNFINNVSPAGGNFAGRYFLKNGFAAGFEFGWNNFYKKYDRMTYYGDDGLAITGIHYTYAFIVPWKAGAYYYFLPPAIADPYVGLSFGGDYMEEHIMIQEYDIYNTQWGFTLSPEAGVLIKFGKYSHWGANVSAQYWFNTNSFDFSGNNKYSTMQGLNFNIGLTYLMR